MSGAHYQRSPALRCNKCVTALVSIEVDFEDRAGSGAWQSTLTSILQPGPASEWQRTVSMCLDLGTVTVSTASTVHETRAAPDRGNDSLDACARDGRRRHP